MFCCEDVYGEMFVSVCYNLKLGRFGLMNSLIFSVLVLNIRFYVEFMCFFWYWFCFVIDFFLFGFDFWIWFLDV